MANYQEEAKRKMMEQLNTNARATIPAGYDWTDYSASERAAGEKFLSKFDYMGNGADSESMLEEYMSKYRSRQDIAKARERYGELTDDNSTYNKNMYKRISRMYQPDGYENTMLYAAMGLGSKSSAYLGQKATQQLERQGQDKTEQAYQGARERAESAAAGYLDLASGREQSLLKIMSDQRIQEVQLRQQKELEDQQREDQMFSSYMNTGLGLAAMFVPGGQGVGASLLAKQFSNDGVGRASTYRAPLEYSNDWMRL